MSSNQVLVLLSASTISSNKFETIDNVLSNDDNIKILNSIKSILLNEEQQSLIPIENAAQFCNGPIAGYLIKNDNEIDFDAIQKTNKLSNNDIFKTTNSFFITTIKQILFPQKAALEQTLILCNPPLSEQISQEIAEELKLKGIFVLFQQELSSETNTNITSYFQSNSNNAENVDENEDQNVDENKEETITCTAILCESFGAIDTLQTMIGCDDTELCPKYSPNSWLNTYNKENYKFIQISDGSQIESIVPKLTSEQTLALIKPCAVSKGYVDNIINEMKQYGFTIISQKRVHLKIEHAQHFYTEHEGKPFYPNLTEFMSSGPIYAFILERIGAIKCWRTCLGPTNTLTAKEKSPQSIRAKYGTDQTANACHGSDSIESSKREIKFYFPEITISNNDISNKKSINIVEEYMSQKLENNETLKEFLIRGLSELSKVKPGNKLEVVEYFGKWLLENNPNKPLIHEPEFEENENFESMTFKQKLQHFSSSNDIQIIFILGGPGSGKGTQCKQIVDKYGFIQISTGDLFRECVNDKTNELGIKIKEIMEKGELVPTELVLKMLKNKMLKLKSNKYLLDGFPRSLDQAIMFEKDIIPCKFAINFKCNDEILIERCLKRAENGSGRVDDNKETIMKRLTTFHNETDPTVEYLKSINKIKEIDATKSVNEVWNDVMSIMNQCQ